MVKSEPSSDSGESTGSSKTPQNAINNGGGVIGCNGGFGCHVCRKAFSTMKALSGHNYAHQTIPVAAMFCCHHAHRCLVITSAADHHHRHRHRHRHRHHRHDDNEQRQAGLVTLDLLREWLPIYVVRAAQRAQAAAEKPAEVGPAEEEDEGGLDLELKL